MTYGYCRISTKKQNIERQIQNIRKEYPDAIIMTEEYTGTTVKRPVFQKLLKAVKEGDIIVFDEVSRMSRNAEEGFAQYEELFEAGIGLVFLKEHYIDTDVYREALKDKVAMTGTDVDLILEGVSQYLRVLAKRQIEIAFDTAEHEGDFLHKRTSEGVRRAQALGKMVGRQPGITVNTKKGKAVMDAIRKYSRDFGGTLNDIEVMKLAGCDRHTYYKYKGILKSETWNDEA